MTDMQRITEPASLSDPTIGLSDLIIDTSKSSRSTIQPQLVLLQPLAKADMLAACRDPDSRFIRSIPSGLVSGPGKHEYLNLQSLGLAWRQAWTKAKPIRQVTFDLTLPKEDLREEGFEKVYWDVAPPEQGGIAVRTQDVMNLVITLATAARMRVKGDMRFKVIYDEAEGVSMKGMKLLEQQLAALAEHKAPAEEKEAERRETEERDHA